METYRENFETILDLGFDAEIFGDNAVKINAVPKILKDHLLKNLFMEMLNDLVTHKKIKDIDYKTQQTIAFLSCRSAVKAGDFLTIDEQKNILKKLDETSDTYTCPHGRPVKILIKTSELARMFKRTK
jgi:DNA mismatch repair protein MutL